MKSNGRLGLNIVVTKILGLKQWVGRLASTDGHKTKKGTFPHAEKGSLYDDFNKSQKRYLQAEALLDGLHLGSALTIELLILRSVGHGAFHLDVELNLRLCT